MFYQCYMFLYIRIIHREFQSRNSQKSYVVSTYIIKILLNFIKLKYLCLLLIKCSIFFHILFYQMAVFVVSNFR
jgi:hypothetical protein